MARPRLKDISDQLELIHPGLGLSLKFKRRPNGSEYLYLLMDNGAGGKLWKQLASAYNVSERHLKLAEKALLAEALETVRAIQTREEERSTPVATGTLSSLVIKARAELEADETLSLQRVTRRKAYLDGLARHLEERRQQVSPKTLLQAIRSKPDTSRERREWETAARQLARIAGFVLDVPKADRWRDASPKATAGGDPGLALQGLEILLRYQRDRGLTDDCTAQVMALVASTGGRMTNLLGWRGWSEPGSQPVQVGHMLDIWDGKRGKSARLIPSWADPLELVGGVGQFADVPLELMQAALPWNRPPSREEQHRGARFAARLTMRVHHRVPDELRAHLSARYLRHLAAGRLLDVPQLSTLQVAEALSTGVGMLQEIYSDHHRFRVSDVIAGAFRAAN